MSVQHPPSRDGRYSDYRQEDPPERPRTRPGTYKRKQQSDNYLDSSQDYDKSDYPQRPPKRQADSEEKYYENPSPRSQKYQTRTSSTSPLVRRQRTSSAYSVSPRSARGSRYGTYRSSTGSTLQTFHTRPITSPSRPRTSDVGQGSSSADLTKSYGSTSAPMRRRVKTASDNRSVHTVVIDKEMTESV